ncbi:MAG: permease-like cell division protein FtsX [Acidobacteria bacterium]|nr:permease-like cell division protein FtsX [Acidobacteriota bacterium]
MTWLQAIAYFVGEALLSLRRGWRVGLLAILTIAVSLFLGGLFALVSHNLRGQLEAWRGEARIVVYFSADASQELLIEARGELAALSWVEAVELVTLADARERFGQAFPDLVDVLDDPDADPLPPSLEVRLVESVRVAPLSETRHEWLSGLDGAEWVDDDRVWLDRLESIVRAGRVVGWGLGGLLLAAAIFTISSVIRLTAYRYRDEIAVMRQIGATELLIRCPFYLEGFLQGLAGGLLAMAGLWLVYAGLGPDAPAQAVREALIGKFLPASSVLAFLALGALAGGVGAIFSLRREFVELDPGID